MVQNTVNFHHIYGRHIIIIILEKEKSINIARTFWRILSQGVISVKFRRSLYASLDANLTPKSFNVMALWSELVI